MRTRLLALPAAALMTLALSACGSDEEAPAAEPSGCQYVETGDAAKPADLPPSDPQDPESLTIATNRGDIAVTLDAANAPCAVNSFASLAEQGYFDDTVCHRVVPGFVLQCGDPTATGTGGPGYSFADEVTGAETYPAGTLAMANSGPDTNGSQFFIVLEGAQLDPLYTVFGTVDEAGLQVAEDIAAEGNGPDGVAPLNEVRIESVS